MIKSSMKESLENSLDEEWVDLVLHAKSAGLTSTEVRKFIIEHRDFRSKKIYLQFIQDKRN
ncbi:anti-repressor SinI family protein [Virgibacillus necropolis]|uniref:anti-repressor SinI family protein n=1 Tax=Virgibacillus necropolis TaxID=163877 RepID=UPI003850D46B